METLTNLECFVRSAAFGSFSEAARRMSLTPAAVSRNIATLERNLGVRLFHRSTRKLTLTEAGETLHAGVADPLGGIQSVIAGIAGHRAEAIGTLKVSVPPVLGKQHLLPLLPALLARHPGIRPEMYFEARPVDLVAEGFDVALGGGFELSAGIVARTLAPAHIIAVASPAYLATVAPPTDPAGLQALRGIVMRSRRTGPTRHWSMRDEAGREVPGPLAETLVVNEHAAMRDAALLGLGVAMLAVPDVLLHLDAGRLVRVLPRWHADAGSISIYYASRKQLPAKTRAFVDGVVEACERERWAERFSAATPALRGSRRRGGPRRGT